MLHTVHRTSFPSECPKLPPFTLLSLMACHLGISFYNADGAAGDSLSKEVGTGAAHNPPTGHHHVILAPGPVGERLELGGGLTGTSLPAQGEQSTSISETPTHK